MECVPTKLNMYFMFHGQHVTRMNLENVFHGKDVTSMNLFQIATNKDPVFFWKQMDKDPV
jgi:hypothetical protein